MKDLFETPEQQSADLQAVLLKWEPAISDGLNYNQCEDMLKEVEVIGYTFDYYLDAVPYGLRPIGIPIEDIEGFEE